jgi:predicted transcriptional regulator
MSASINQMALRRKAHSISRREIQRKIDCSESWIRWLEAGYYKGPAVRLWRKRYADALEAAIKEKKGA